MSSLQPQGVFTLDLINRLETKHYIHKQRRRMTRFLRPLRGGRRSVLRWRRSELELLPKLWQRDRSLSIHPRHCRAIQDNPHPRLEPSATPSDEEPPLYFSFSGGGWLMVYMYGVCKALREQKFDTNARFIGTSAGCLSIVSLVLDSDFDAICESVVNDYVPAAHASWQGPFKMRDYLIDAITKHGKMRNFDRLDGKVTVVYTSLSAWVTRRVSHFKNPLHLLQTMVASCCATPLVGMPFELENEYVIDGGLLDNQPLFEGVRTITVTPNVFADADICPSRYVPPWWSMYPPSQRDMQWLYDLGYEDALSWCVREGLPGSERIEVPTKAAEYDGEWRATLGQVVGYRSIEDAVLTTAKLFLLSEETISCSVIRLELLVWKFVAVVMAVLGRTTPLSAVVATRVLLVLVMLEHRSLEFVLLLGVALACVKAVNTCSHIHSSEQWSLLHEAVVAMEKHRTVNKHGFTVLLARLPIE